MFNRIRRLWLTWKTVGTATSEGLRAMRERAGWSEEGEQQRIEEGWTRRAYETIAILEAGLRRR